MFSYQHVHLKVSPHHLKLPFLIQITMAMQDRMATWQANWLEDEEEQDSDTDSKLSGSAAADSVM